MTSINNPGILFNYNKTNKILKNSFFRLINSNINNFLKILYYLNQGSNKLRIYNHDNPFMKTMLQAKMLVHNEKKKSLLQI